LAQIDLLNSSDSSSVSTAVHASSSSGDGLSGKDVILSPRHRLAATDRSSTRINRPPLPVKATYSPLGFHQPVALTLSSLKRGIDELVCASNASSISCALFNDGSSLADQTLVYLR